MRRLVSELLARAQTILQDKAGTRWPVSELVGWVNDGAGEVVRLKPSATAATIFMPLVTGARQQLQYPYVYALRFIGNARTAQSDARPRHSVTVVDRAMLDAVQPTWQDSEVAGQVEHVVYDEAEPRTFYVYPPNDGTGVLSLSVSYMPGAIQPTAGAEKVASYGVPIPLEDTYFSVLLNYVLYRAYAKDAQFNAGGSQLAVAYKALFDQAVGIASGVEANMSPNQKPGVPAAAPGVTA